MKTIQPDPSSWMGYVQRVKELVDRELTNKDYKKMMYGYINNTPIKDIIKQLEE